MSDIITDPEANAIVAKSIIDQLQVDGEILVGLAGEFSFTNSDLLNIAVKVEFRGRKVTVFETRAGKETFDHILCDPNSEAGIADVAIMFINYLGGK